jgi:hypothetical protein
MILIFVILCCLDYILFRDKGKPLQLPLMNDDCGMP